MAKNKVVKMQKHSIFNIGTIMFGLLFVYMIICLVMYLSATHITAYEVTAGSLSGNYRYTALALKSETIVYSNQAGPITYYAKEDSKVGAATGIYSIGKLNSTDLLAQSTEEDIDYSNLRSVASAFARNYKSVSYPSVYNFKADAQTAMLEILSQTAMDLAQKGLGSSSLNLIPAQRDGIVVYSIDHMEDLTPEEVTMEHFNTTNYKKENLRLRESIKAKDPVYKLVTSEQWSLMIPLDRKTATELSNTNIVRFTFLEDGSTFNADFSILQNDDQFFGKLDIGNSVLRFADDRYVEIELLVNKQTGLKIPNSAIAKKIFYKVPKEYVTVRENNENEIGILKETYDTDGSAITKYISATVYDKTDSHYLVDTTVFQEGDYVLMPDSSKRYQISETETLTGVYNINKGYAVFREITIIDENEEYCIVESESNYGLSQYDHIALDSSAVKEDGAVI